jgi:hypothetical protein
MAFSRDEILKAWDKATARVAQKPDDNEIEAVSCSTT